MEKLTLGEKIDRAKNGRTQTWIIKQMVERGCIGMNDVRFSRAKYSGGFSGKELKILSNILGTKLSVLIIALLLSASLYAQTNYPAYFGSRSGSTVPYTDTCHLDSIHVMFIQDCKTLKQAFARGYTKEQWESLKPDQVIDIIEAWLKRGKR